MWLMMSGDVVSEVYGKGGGASPSSVWYVLRDVCSSSSSTTADRLVGEWSVCLHRQGMASSPGLSWWFTCGWLLQVPLLGDASRQVSVCHQGPDRIRELASPPKYPDVPATRRSSLGYRARAVGGLLVR